MQRDKLYLIHIAESIDKIEKYTVKLNEDDFKSNEMIQDAVIRQLEIIGEASKNVSEELRKKEKQLPWSEMAKMRDFLIHHYFGVSIDIVWTTIKNDIPSVRKKIKDIIAQL